MAVTYGSGSFKTVTEMKEAEKDTGELTNDDLISRNIQKISHNVLQIKQMVQNIGTPLDSEELRHRMSILQSETNQITKDTNMALKTISSSNNAAENKEQEKLKIKIRLLRENFHDVLKDYNEIQKTAKTKQRQTIRMKLRDSITQGEESAATKDGEQSQAMLQIEIVQQEVDLELVKEREKALQQLEQDIIDINIIFKDLAAMVYEQGEDITRVEKHIDTVQKGQENSVTESEKDTVEENVENAAENIEEGVKELEKAVEYQSSSRRKKIFLIIILCAVLVVIAVIIIVVVTQTS